MSRLRSFLFGLLGVFALGLLSLSLVSSGQAQGIPNWINYQGRLTNADGAPVSDGAWPVVFRLYDSPTASGTALWEESRSVTTRSGAFGTTLGQSVVLDPLLFARPLWLEIEVNGRKLTPRQALGSVPFAMTALSVPSGTVTTVMLAHLCVTTEKLADGAVTDSKLAPGVAVPVGSVVAWWGNSATPPAGWQVCDGKPVADDASPLKGQTLPDLRDRFIRGGAGDVRNSPALGGADDHTLSVDEMPAHTHGVNDPGHQHNLTVTGYGAGPFDGSRVRIDSNSPLNTWNLWSDKAMTGISIQPAGGGKAFNVVPRYVGLIFIMRIR